MTTPLKNPKAIRVPRSQVLGTFPDFLGPSPKGWTRVFGVIKEGDLVGGYGWRFEPAKGLVDRRPRDTEYVLREDLP